MVISIVIPVFNTLKYLPECLQSIERQNFDDKEIILVDDGSTDGSSEYCDTYKKEHQNVKVIHKENEGASDSRNRGLLASSGEYIHFIDSDDILLGCCVYSNFLTEVYPQKPEVMLARFEEYSPNLAELENSQMEYETEGLYEGDVLKEVLVHQYPATLTSPVNKIFSRSFLLDNDLFFTKGIDHEEDEWLPRVLACAQKTWFSNNVIYGVRKGRSGSLSETLNEQALARKSCSKIKIASMGIKYMEEKKLSLDTIALVTEYYWDYLIDACVACNKLSSKPLKMMIFNELKVNVLFFDSYKFLKSANRRVLGLLFKTIGVKLTAKLIGIRYGE